MDTMKQNDVHGICVSVLVVVRNEEQYIEQCLMSILNQSFDPKRYEILVLDGMSTDRTRGIVRRLIDEHQDYQIRLLDNRQKILAAGWNLGIRESKGEILIRMDGHASIDRDFISESVRVLNEHAEAWCVGGPITTIGDSFIGKVIAASMSSPIGVGDARFRLGGYEGYVDTVAFGAYRKEVFHKIGLLDEKLPRTEDDDLHFRIRAGGGKIFISLRIHSKYYSRSNLIKLWRQYFQYGFWRIRTIQKHRRPATFRQVVPLAFVSCLILLALAGIVWPVFWLALALLLATYTLGLIYGCIHVGTQTGWKYAVLAPLIFAILHFAYGFGSLWGVLRFILLGGRFMSKPGDLKLSR